MSLAACGSCEGLLPRDARACPHCDQPIRRSWAARLARLACGGVAAVTLMACYGGPAYYDTCFDNDGDGWFPACYGAACDPEIDPNCDCNDNASNVFPGALDPLGDGYDQDCSGADGPGRKRIDAGIDADLDAVDAEIDAPIDAEIDAPIDADDAGIDAPIDAIHAIDAPIDALGDFDGV